MTAMTVGDALNILTAECERLRADNTVLRGDLAAARQSRDTAQAQATHYRTYYTRSGW